MCVFLFIPALKAYAFPFTFTHLDCLPLLAYTFVSVESIKKFSLPNVRNIHCTGFVQRLLKNGFNEKDAEETSIPLFSHQPNS